MLKAMLTKEQPSVLFFDNTYNELMDKPIVKHILLVDDDDVTNFIHEQKLTEMGIAAKISMAANGSEALDIINASAQKPEVIMLDINMPVMNGIDFLEKFEKEAQAGYNPRIFIMLTTQLTNDDKTRIQNLNHLITGFMDKPVNNTTFLTLLKKYF